MTQQHETSVPHGLGTVSLARLEPGTASSELFVCLSESAPALDPGGQPPMDGRGYAVFGRVVEGLDVARAIHALPTEEEAPLPMLRGQFLSDPVEFEVSLDAWGSGSSRWCRDQSVGKNTASRRVNPVTG